MVAGPGAGLFTVPRYYSASRGLRPYLERAVNRQLGGISPLAFIGGLVFLSDIMVLKYGKPKTIQYTM